jgi:hypothetical protein
MGMKNKKNNAFSILYFVCGLISFAPSITYAACANPAGTEAKIAYSSAQNVPMFCNGSQWISMGELNPAAGGAGCATVTSGVKPEGHIFYNTDYHFYQYCDGDDWHILGGAPVSGSSFLTFTDLTDQPTSTLVTGNILQVSLGGPVSISGDGSPEYRICADDACSSQTQTWGSSAGSISSGEFLQLRLTSAAVTNTTNIANVTVGNATDQWTVTTSGTAIIFLTSGTSWQVPADWNNTNNTIEVLGGGGGGANASDGSYGGGGGGGGGYSKTANVTLTPGGTVTYAVGTGGGAGSNGGDAYFCDSISNCSISAACGSPGSAVKVCASGGVAASGTTAGGGGAAGSGIGDVTNSGGGGGAGKSSAWGGAGGGGGAAGPNGDGGNGGSSTGTPDTGAGGGGGANGGTNGSDGTNTAGSAGGNNRLGIGGGAGDDDLDGSPGTAGGGGGGGGDGNGAGGAGSEDTIWTQTSDSATAGPGSGGGGGGGCNTCSGTNAIGGAGGGYGGGGGGGGESEDGTDGVGAAGTQGIIVITYTSD